ncbi:unnamed protein product [Phytomonas sp. EM1]|nr:unnamed protein product [Phytomonas sp. EM1]|eukprot:CCW61261.1 unnamed protein product [Phytomonas sp. isolate EM1]
MFYLERSPILRVVKASGAVAAALLAYQGFCLYRRNNITIRITELVKLPPQGRIGRDLGCIDFIHNDPTIEVKGSIEVETYLMRSYRFLLKLSAQLNETTIGGNSCNYGGGGDDSGCKRSIRRRVLSFATAYNNTNINTPDNVPRMDNLSSSNSHLSTIKPQHNSLTTESYRKANIHSFSRSHPRPKGPMIQLEYVNEMVDLNEMLVNENICFTPACLSEEILIKYTTMISSSYLLDSRPALSSVASDSVEPFNALSTSPPCLSNLVIQNSFLKPDKPGCQCISFDLTALQPLHELRLLVRLPNRYCRLVRSNTGGIGRVVLAEGSAKPHLLIWEIGSVDAHIHNNVKKGSKVAKAHEDGALSPAMLSAVGGDNAHSLSSFAFLSVHFELVYRQLEESEYGYYDSERREDSDSNIDSDDNDFLSSGASGTSDEDPNKTDLMGRQIDATEEYFINKRGVENKNNKQRGSRKSSFVKKTHPSCTPSPPNQSDKARRRQALALKKKRERQLRRAMPASSGLGVHKNQPTLEVTYSVTGLASGVNVRRLQVLDEKINWTPRSVIDRMLLRYILPDLQTLKLNKFAHYTTWFVQPIILTEWNA